MSEELEVAKAEERDKETLPAKVEGQKQPVQRQVDFGPEIEKLLPTVGTIKLTKEEEGILFAPVDEALVEIRPDGLIYLSWMQYVTRLRRALGISWGLIPQMLPRMKDGLMVRPFWFLIRGTLVTEVIGEQHISSSTMTWAEAAEGCRSNALMRACKALGITLELWDPAFIRGWKKKYAVHMRDTTNRIIWVKKEFDPESGIPLVMTAEKAVEKAMELFPGSSTDAALPGSKEVPPEVVPQDDIEGFRKTTELLPPTDVTPSATLFVKYHDDMVRLAHISLLRDYWTKNGAEAEAKLHPNHFKLLTELKDKLRKQFIDKAMKEKGGK
jgi:hypothetical protein